MNKHITRVLAATTAASAALITLGLTSGAADAATRVPQATVTKGYTNRLAGYVMSGPRFKYVAAKLRVPVCRAHSGNRSAVIALLTSTGLEADLVVRCGGGTGSVHYIDAPSTAGTFRLSPAVGDVLKISIFRHRLASVDAFSATDTRTGRTQTIKVPTSARVYRIGAMIALFNNTQVVNPASDIRLWAFRNAQLTTYSGARGSVFGPWLTVRVYDTTTGRASGAVVASPSYPTNGGLDFNIYLRHR